MKFAFNYLDSDLDLLTRYARACGMALAKAHARSGDAAMIAGYLGKGDTLDRIPSFIRSAICQAELTGLQGLDRGCGQRQDRG